MLDLIERKAAGEEIVVEAAPAPATTASVVDLMAALEASVTEAREARKRHPTALDSGDSRGQAKHAQDQPTPPPPQKKKKKKHFFF